MSFINLPEADFSKAYFYPYEQGVLGHSDPQVITQGQEGLRLTTTPDYIWDDNPPNSFEGILTYSIDGVVTGSNVVLTVGKSYDIGVAAIRGLILNLMPCVFPVISIKALSIAKCAHGERAKIKREAWLYTAGVIATFMLLVLFILGLKAGGAEIGWGFQLQSPKVVAALAVLLFVIGLNLLGAFEFGSGLQNTGAELTLGDWVCIAVPSHRLCSSSAQ